MRWSLTGSSVTAFARSNDDVHAEGASSLAEARRQGTRALLPSSAAGKGGAPSGFLSNGEVMIRRPLNWSPDLRGASGETAASTTQNITQRRDNQ